ncbi:hypothetical protein QFC20_000854 [Naganishia adeliensis]|uniref:Uncharacterized protein n=1 Tax=Naganishia adeliensis TaxID=92952 RepID=A0ACC2WYJ6_9TREE|nr:hypothetical protein QFC20_000854 [Naganishia adeliensis]
MIGLLQRRKVLLTAFAATCVLLLLLHPTPVGQYARQKTFGTTYSKFHTSEVDETRVKHPWTRLISGVDGFYVFENVYVKDRQLFMVPHPQDPPLPELKKIITSVVHENYTRDAASFRPTPAERLFEGEDDHNGDYPQVPRLRVLTSVAEAKREIPGWGEMERYAQEDGYSWVETYEKGGWFSMGANQKLQDPAVQVLDGMNWYLADDPAITEEGEPYLQGSDGDQAEENIVGIVEEDEDSQFLPAEDDADVPKDRRRSMRSPRTRRGWPFSSGYKPSERDLEIQRQYLPMPKRVISPWCTNWEGRELNEMVLFNAFGYPKAYRRNDWRKLSRDRQWRMFDKVVITDRHAAHNDKSSQTDIWNKMALGILHEPVPADLPHWFTAPQESLTTSLSLPAIPLERAPSSGGARRHSLADSFVKIVYVDRQNSDRRFDNISHDGLMKVLEDMDEHGAKWKEREKGSGGEKMSEMKIKVKVDVVKFEHLNAKEQIEAVYDADIIIGVHGNGLTHIVWAKPGATVIEAFPVGTFIRDYELLSYALDHKYYCIWNEREYTKDEWIHNNGNIEAGKLHDGTEIALDAAFIKSLIKKAVRNMT